MQERPVFSATEFLSSALLLACALVALVYTGEQVYDADTLGAMQSGGLAIMLLAAVADPVNYFADCLLFPFHRRAPSDYRTRLTVAASALGCGLSGLGWLLDLYSTYFGA